MRIDMTLVNRPFDASLIRLEAILLIVIQGGVVVSIQRRNPGKCRDYSDHLDQTGEDQPVSLAAHS